MDESPGWHLYILRCADGSLYTGITTDVARRVAEHNESDKGAKYTRSRRPVMPVYTARYADKSEASAAEWRIKKLSRAQKTALIEAGKLPD